MPLSLLLLLLGEILVQVVQLVGADLSLPTHQLSHVVETGLVQLEILLLDDASGRVHLLLNLADLLVALVDGNGLDLLGKRQLLDGLLDLLERDLGLLLSGEERTKKSSISTIGIQK